MATIELTPTSLVVHITGADQFFALASRLEVPLEHIAGVDSTVPEAHGVFHGLRLGGTNVPGLITAGRFLRHASGLSGTCMTLNTPSASGCMTSTTRS